MMVIRTSVAVLVLAAALAIAPSAMAYDEVSEPTDAVDDPARALVDAPLDCPDCHVSTPSVEGTGAVRQGPHGGYTATSRVCNGCHQVHTSSPLGYMLLPGPTTTETCELCHDGTGGEGVYGTITARGLTVESAHRVDATSAVTLIPGGDAVSGGSTEVTFGGLSGTLSCGDCHSPHGANVVAEFTGDRMRIATDTAGFTSSRILKKQPTGAPNPNAIEVYGSDWCGSCHAGRLSGVHEDLFNHPVDASATAGPGTFYYENVQVSTGANTSELGTLGRSNHGYVMPWPRTSGQEGHDPICQQCHEDARSVANEKWAEVTPPDEEFTVTVVDGGSASDNPRFQVFPHESTNQGLLVETDDSLCTNCHNPGKMK